MCEGVSARERERQRQRERETERERRKNICVCVSAHVPVVVGMPQSMEEQILQKSRSHLKSFGSGRLV